MYLLWIWGDYCAYLVINKFNLSIFCQSINLAWWLNYYFPEGNQSQCFPDEKSKNQNTKQGDFFFPGKISGCLRMIRLHNRSPILFCNKVYWPSTLDRTVISMILFVKEYHTTTILRCGTFKKKVGVSLISNLCWCKFLSVGNSPSDFPEMSLQSFKDFAKNGCQDKKFKLWQGPKSNSLRLSS